MFEWIRKIPIIPLVMMSIVLGIAPFNGEPHLLEKLSMLGEGTLTKPLDIFDLFLHGTPSALLIIRLYLLATASRATEDDR